jgi:hypothetical protein
MKTFPVLAALFALAPVALLAQGTDAMPPETKAPAQDAMPMKAPVPPSHGVTITFQGRTTVLKIEDLTALPQVTVHVHNEHRNADEDYTGPLLSDVLAKAGLTATKETQPLILHSTVVATGTDHYYVIYSAAEVEPAFNHGQVIVAIAKSGGLPNTEGGAIELVNTTDTKPARWLHGLTQLNIMSLNQNQ